MFRPEQEYLSRFYADRWTHISGTYNFQLYRLDTTRAIQKLAPTLEPGLVDTLHAVQYSSHPKPWDLVDMSEEEMRAKIKAVHEHSADFALATGPRAGVNRLGSPQSLLDLTHELVLKWIDVFAEAVKKSPEPDLAAEFGGVGSILGITTVDKWDKWSKVNPAWNGTPWRGRTTWDKNSQ